MNIWKSQYTDECAGSFASHVGHKLPKFADLYNQSQNIDIY